jgi:hypothetical protein
MTSRPRPQLHLARNTQDPAAPPAAATTPRAHRPRLPMPPAPHAANHTEQHPATQRQRLAPRPAPVPADRTTGDRALDLLPELSPKLGATLPMPPPSDRPASRRRQLAQGKPA